MKLTIVEKPSVAVSIAKVLITLQSRKGYLVGSGWLVSWCVGHLAELTQLVFCDIPTPKAAPSKRFLKGGGNKLDNPLLNMMENAVPLEPEKPFTIYEDIRQKLIAGGMAPEQIAFIHEAKTNVQKKALFAKVRAEQVRIFYL